MASFPKNWDNLKKGDIVFHFHPAVNIRSGQPSKVKSGPHQYVILHSYKSGLNVYQAAPITSTKGDIPNTCVELKAENYPGILKKDSYIDLRFITPIDKIELKPSKDASTNTVHNPIPSLIPKDLNLLDIHLILTLELMDSVNAIADLRLKEQLSEVVDYIDNSFKSDIKNILSKIEDEIIKKEIIDLIDKLISQIN